VFKGNFTEEFKRDVLAMNGCAYVCCWRFAQHSQDEQLAASKHLHVNRKSGSNS